MSLPTVLVVDDSPVDRRVAGGLLEQHLDCNVRYASDGKDALTQMAQEAPDLVVTDLQMPEMNGLELVGAVKNDFPLVPVILMTAAGSEEIAAQALKQGAASYVPKRKLADDLAATVRKVLISSWEDRAGTQLMHYLEASDSTFVLSNDPTLLRALVHHVQNLLRCLPLDDENERLRVGIALEEALLNACYHGNLGVGSTRALSGEAMEDLIRARRLESPYRDRRIRVQVRVSRHEAVFVVADDGPGFDVAGLTGGLGAAQAETGVGRGLVLMRTIMDEVRFNDRGNEVTLVKRRAPEAPLEDD